MKKLVVLAIAAAGAFWAFNKSKADKAAERDLWSEATDRV